MRLLSFLVPRDKPILVPVAFHNAAASSLIHSILNNRVSVLDVGENLKSFLK